MADKQRIEGDAEWRSETVESTMRHEAATTANSAEDHRTMAMLAWALLAAGVVTGIAAFAAVLVAYVKRGDASPLWRGHYNGVVRMFWIWLLLTIVGTPLILLFGLGYLILAVAAIWTAVVSVVGLIRASENKPN